MALVSATQKLEYKLIEDMDFMMTSSVRFGILITLPNRMIGSAYVGAWRVSDTVFLNTSGLGTYLSGVLS